MTKINYIEDELLGDDTHLSRTIKDIGLSLGLGGTLVASLNYLKDGELTTAANFNRAFRELLAALGLDPDGDKENFINDLNDGGIVYAPDAGISMTMTPSPFSAGAASEFSGTATFEATIIDVAVVAVEYWSKDKKIAGPFMTAPFTFEWNTLEFSTQEHAIHARGFNAAAEHIATSASKRFVASHTASRVWLSTPTENDISLWSGTKAVVIHGRRADHLGMLADGALHSQMYMYIYLRIDGFLEPAGNAGAGSDFPKRLFNRNINVDTTKFRNGRHQILVSGKSTERPFEATPYFSAPSWYFRTVEFNNGSTPMQARCNYSTVWLAVGETVQLTVKIVNCDLTESVTSISNATISATGAASVSVAGLITALVEGYAEVTVTASNGMTTIVKVVVMAVRHQPHFGKGNNGLRTTYDAVESIFLMATFWLVPAELTHARWAGRPAGEIIKHVKYAGVNTWNPGCFYSPTSPTTLAAWKATLDSIVDPDLAASVTHDMYCLCAGDDITRGKINATRLLSWADWQPAIVYAFEKLRDSDRVIAVDMVDEVNLIWGDDPTPAPADPWNDADPNYDVPNTWFADLRAAIDTVANHPPITFPVLGASGEPVAELWMGPGSVSDYATVFNPPWPAGNDTAAFPDGGSIEQSIAGAAQTMWGWLNKLKPSRARLMLVGMMGMFYDKRAYQYSEYVPGIDIPIVPGAGRAIVVSSGVWFAVAAGAAGIKVYSFDAYHNAAGRGGAGDPIILYDINNLEQIIGQPQTASDPILVGTDRWYALGNACSLARDLQELCLAPNYHSPDFGPRFFTGVKKTANRTLLIIGSMSEIEEPINVDLTPYQYVGGQTIKHRVIAGERITSAIVSTVDAYDFEIGEVAIYEFRHSALPDLPAIKFTKPVFSDARISGGMMELAVADTGGAAINHVEFYVDAVLVADILVAPWVYSWDADAWLATSAGRTNVWIPVGAIAYTATGESIEARMLFMVQA